MARSLLKSVVTTPGAGRVDAERRLVGNVREGAVAVVAPEHVVGFCFAPKRPLGDIVTYKSRSPS